MVEMITQLFDRIKTFLSAKDRRREEQVQIERDGRVSHVAVLEAPDADTARVVAASVRAWQFSPFRPATTAQALRVRGKITLYFELNAKEGTVLSSLEKIQRGSRRR